MENNTQQVFKAIIKNCCLGLREISNTDQKLTEDQKQELDTFLDQMDMNYFDLKPKSREQENMKAMFSHIHDTTALGKVTTILQTTYMQLL